METGIRFSSPTLDIEDYKKMSNMFNVEIEELIEVVENAPQEISIVVSLLKKILEKFNNTKWI